MKEKTWGLYATWYNFMSVGQFHLHSIANCKWDLNKEK